MHRSRALRITRALVPRRALRGTAQGRRFSFLLLVASLPAIHPCIPHLLHLLQRRHRHGAGHGVTAPQKQQPRGASIVRTHNRRDRSPVPAARSSIRRTHSLRITATSLSTRSTRTSHSHKQSRAKAPESDPETDPVPTKQQSTRAHARRLLLWRTHRYDERPLEAVREENGVQRSRGRGARKAKASERVPLGEDHLTSTLDGRTSKRRVLDELRLWRSIRARSNRGGSRLTITSSLILIQKHTHAQCREHDRRADTQRLKRSGGWD